MPGSQKTRKQPFWLGGASASMAACFTHPLDLTKVRMQTRPGTAPKATMLGTLTSSIRNLGIRSVYTGISAALMRQMSYSMVRFGCYEHMKNVITEGGRKRPTAIQLVVAGGIAGGLGGVAGNPADILLVRMTTDEVRPEKDRFRYKHAINGLIRLIREEGVSALARGMSANVESMLSVIKKSLRTEGVRFLFKGWTPAFVRLAPNTVLLFVFLEQLKKLYAQA
ncbi:Mitochondrial dicarboxylate transporter [Ceratobasidium sp. 423]|nr:Mitochondrial dicarboxylate transporter [Ceratobasidium sp. 423]